jgi:hypothetical protein
MERATGSLSGVGMMEWSRKPTITGYQNSAPETSQKATPTTYLNISPTQEFFNQSAKDAGAPKALRFGRFTVSDGFFARRTGRGPLEWTSGLQQVNHHAGPLPGLGDGRPIRTADQTMQIATQG